MSMVKFFYIFLKKKSLYNSREKKKKKTQRFKPAHASVCCGESRNIPGCSPLDPCLLPAAWPSLLPKINRPQRRARQPAKSSTSSISSPVPTPARVTSSPWLEAAAQAQARRPAAAEGRQGGRLGLRQLRQPQLRLPLALQPLQASAPPRRPQHPARLQVATPRRGLDLHR